MGVRKTAAACFTVLLLLTGAVHAAPPRSALVVEASGGRYLYAEEADAPRHPASVTKVMTLYMLFDALRAGRVSPDTPMRVSARAASRPPSRLGLKPGSYLRVRDAVPALITKSANDVASTVAEYLGNGSEEAFCAEMTRRARLMGMNRTVFHNASGLPDPRQITTAHDMAVLAVRMMRDFPQHYRLFSMRSFNYGGHVHANHNKLLGRVSGVDGLKTGYTVTSGFNLLASCKRGNVRLIAVVFGGESPRARDAKVVRLLENGFKAVREGKALPTKIPGLRAGYGTASVEIPPLRVH